MGHHRAEHRGNRTRRPSDPRAAGRHLAPVAPRTSRLLLARAAVGEVVRRRRLSAVPSVVGVAALVVAGTGAVSGSGPVDLAQAGTAAPQAISVAAGSTTDLEVDGDLLADREAAISRDSQRQALQDAAEVELVQAAEEQARERNATLKSLARATEQRAGELALDQWTLPTSNYRLTGRFGMSGSYWSSSHTGLDFAAPSGTPVVSVAAGTVTSTGYEGAYGNRTVITLEDGTEVWYCHQTSMDVQPGQTVTSGQPIGTVGSTGNSTGPHLHLEIRPGGGDPVDPEQALAFRGLTP